MVKVLENANPVSSDAFTLKEYDLASTSKSKDRARVNFPSLERLNSGTALLRVKLNPSPSGSKPSNIPTSVPAGSFSKNESLLRFNFEGDGFDDEFEIANGFNPRNSSDKVYKPIVDTLDAVQKIGSRYEFRAKIVADGGLEPTSYGFIKGTSLADMSEVMYVSTPVSDQQEFSLDISELVKGETYYFKAFAENAAGLSFGNVNKFTASDHNWWADAEVYQGGWRINWLGAFLPNENGWVYHLDLGWAYVQSDDLDGLWMWMDRTGWVWTTRIIAIPLVIRNIGLAVPD